MFRQKRTKSISRSEAAQFVHRKDTQRRGRTIKAVGFCCVIAIAIIACKASGTLNEDNDDGGSPWDKDKLITLSASNIVLFETNTQGYDLTANLKEGILNLATLEWSVTPEGYVTLEGADTNVQNIKVKVVTKGEAQITARLVPIEDIDPALFGDNPLEASCAVQVMNEAQVSTTPVGDLMLNYDAPPSFGSPVTSTLQASYVPIELSGFDPVITWETDGNSNGISVSENEGVWTVTASAVEPTAKVRAKLTVLGVDYYSAWDTFAVIAFDASKLPITSVNITTKPANIIKTDTEDFSLSYEPDYALYNSIVWEVQNSNGAVDATALTIAGTGANGAGAGTITANKKGAYKVIAKSQSVNGGASSVLAQFDVNVTDITVAVTRSGTGDIVVGGKAQFSAAVNASNKNVTWAVDKTAIAEVSAAGEVTAKKAVSAAAGEVVTVTAKSSADNTTTGSSTVKIVPHKFTIKYDKNGATTGSNPADKEITYGQVVTLDAGTGLAKTGYEFKGWTKQGLTTLVTNTDASVLVETSGGSITLYAKWDANTYKVKYDINGGSVGAGGKADGYTETDWVYGTAHALAKIDTPLIWTRTGYKALGWSVTKNAATAEYSSGASVSNLSATKDATVILYVVWDASDYKLIFNDATGSGGPGNVGIKFNADFPNITAKPTRTGYIFGGYYQNSGGSGTQYYNDSLDKQGTPKFTTAADTTIYAKWTAASYKIEYELNAGTQGASPATTYTIESADVTLPTPTKAGYEFKGWFDNATFTGSAVTKIVKGSTGDKKFYAKWDAASYIITFDAKGGSGGTASGSVTYGGALPNATAPTRTGYNFVGYYYNSTAYYDASMAKKVSSYTLTSNVTLNAEWTAKTYTITFNTQSGTGGSASATATFDAALPVTGLTAPTRSGFNFKGYYTAANGGGTQYYSNTMTAVLSPNKYAAADALTLYAFWTANTYTITYNGLEGASNSNPANYTIETNSISLVNPGTRSGYTFAGWFTNEARTTAAANPVTTKGTTMGNKTFYAKWDVPHEPDLMKKFGVKTGAYALNTITPANVTETFNMVSAFIKTKSASSVNPADGIGTGESNGNIKLGDYVDLGSLSVAEYNGSGAVSVTTNIELSGHGTLLRLIVVGINPYYDKNGNGMDTPHLVFQFQNIPGNARMNATGVYAIGYNESDMKAYLSDNYWAGLQTAGVPEGSVWTPVRKVGKKYGTQDVQDTLWLPTEWELIGNTDYSKNPYPTSGNQGRLAYYNGENERMKYNSNNSTGWWWIADASYTSTSSSFHLMNFGRTAGLISPYYNNGCVPAFCVK